MSKISDWKSVAKEGPTVDGRRITREWLSQMAENYDLEEYTALIWPEHHRFYGFGDNWGRVIALKAEEKNGLMHLFAKLEPNQLLLDANLRKQKLFTSIEPEPDFKGEGKCYLMGLGVTDSPASTGTSMLQFSAKKDNKKQIEVSQLEEIDLTECFSKSERFFALAKDFFTDSNSETFKNNEEEIDVTKEQLQELMTPMFEQFNEKLKSNIQAEINKQFAMQPKEREELAPEATATAELKEQFSQLFETQLAPVLEKITGLETKFNQMSKEIPDQEPGNGSTSISTDDFV